VVIGDNSSDPSNGANRDGETEQLVHGGKE
jgi:hypothetical protein